MQRQQQQQQQHLLNASRVLPAGYALPSGNVSAAAANPLSSAPGIVATSASSTSTLPQGLTAAASLFSPTHLMSAAAAANFQQSLYGKNPYSNTLEQLARQKREGDIMPSDR